MAQTILLIEDEEAIANAVASRLRSEGFAVELAFDGPSGVQRCLQIQPDLVILDIMLPGFDGLEVCRQIQAARRTPVLMLTAKDDETDVLVGLRLGADDYVTKPFSPRLLVARVHAILRRINDDSGVDEAEELTAGDIVLDRNTRRATRGDVEVHLTPTEFNLLAALIEADGGVLSREELLSSVWGYADGSGARTVDSHIRAVRRKMGDDTIRTVHSVGYAIGIGDEKAPT